MTLLTTISGSAGLALCVGSYLVRSHKGLTLMAALGVLCWAIHFASQSLWTPAVMGLLMAVRVAAGVVVVDFERATRWWLTFLVWALIAAGAGLTWQGWTSAPSIVATVFLAYAGFHLHYGPLRKALLVGEALWLVNALVTGSMLALVASILAIGINIYVLLAESRKDAATVTAHKKAANLG